MSVSPPLLAVVLEVTWPLCEMEESGTGDGRIPDDILSLPPASKYLRLSVPGCAKQWVTLPAGGSAGCETVLTEDPSKLIWRDWLGPSGRGVDLLVSADVTCIAGMACCTAWCGAGAEAPFDF